MTKTGGDEDAGVAFLRGNDEDAGVAFLRGNDEDAGVAFLRGKTGKHQRALNDWEVPTRAS